MTENKLCMSLTANTIITKLTYHFQQTRLYNTIKHYKHTDKHYLKITSAQVVETLVTNEFFSELPLPGQLTITEYQLKDVL